MINLKGDDILSLANKLDEVRARYSKDKKLDSTRMALTVAHSWLMKAYDEAVKDG